MSLQHFLGLDLGGTKVAAGVVASDGRVLSHLREATSTLRAAGDPLSGILGLGREAVRAAGEIPLHGVGIALPGPADAAGLRLIQAPTIPELEGVALEAPLRDTFGAPVAGDNDANACALAESRFGAARGSRSMVYFTVSTGIGGGIVVDGMLFRGGRGTSAELGHQVILPYGGPPCDCGGVGCLEALASGRGIARRAREARPEWESLTAADLADRAREGDMVALRIWQETALYLGLGVSNVINVLDPEVVVLGGGVAVGAADLLLDPVREVVRTRCMPILRRDVPIRVAGLGLEVGLVGAAALAMPPLGEV